MVPGCDGVFVVRGYEKMSLKSSKRTKFWGYLKTGHPKALMVYPCPCLSLLCGAILHFQTDPRWQCQKVAMATREAPQCQEMFHDLWTWGCSSSHFTKSSQLLGPKIPWLNGLKSSLLGSLAAVQTFPAPWARDAIGRAGPRSAGT